MIAKSALASRERFVRATHVVCHWRDGWAVLTNYATGRSLTGPAVLADIANACAVPKAPADVRHAFPDLSTRTIAEFMTQLADETILRLASKRPSRAERAMDALGPWNPAAGFFHTSTKNVQFGDTRKPETIIGAASSSGALPEPVKRYPGCPMVRLPVATVRGEFSRVLLARRTHRQFSPTGVTLTELATLLQLTVGFQGWLSLKPRNLAPLRTSPSAGARHPIEAYVLARNIDHLAPGLYHYASDRHRLERLSNGSSPCPIQRYLPSQDWFESAAALVIFVARFTQTRWRYPYSRAYRSVLIEAGHVCQTFCLTATWLGLAPFSTAAFDDDAVEGDLRIDGIRESALYVAGVGRPHAVRSRRSSPDGVPNVHVISNPVFSGQRRRRR